MITIENDILSKIPKVGLEYLVANDYYSRMALVGTEQSDSDSKHCLTSVCSTAIVQPYNTWMPFIWSTSLSVKDALVA